MNQTLLQALANYNNYANTILLETVAKLNAEELKAAPSPSRGSVLILVHHIFAVEAHFLAECRGELFTFDPQTVATLSQLTAFGKTHGNALTTFISVLDDATCTREIEVHIGEHTFRLAIWQVLTQLFLHSAQHRGELSILLTELGYPLAIDDIIVHFIEGNGQLWP